MFSQFSKILDRTFVIGYFLPLVVFVAVSVWLVNSFGVWPELTNKLEDDLLIGTTVLGLATWVGGMLLVLLNRAIYQILEGYYWWNPIRFWKPVQLRRFHKLRASAERLDAEYWKLANKPKHHAYEHKRQNNQDQRNEVNARLADHFPEERWILPTGLGNIIRAFEVYPRIMYGIEDIQGWTRLLAILPKSYVTTVDDAKARTDFWVNATVLSIAALVEYAAMAASTHRIVFGWFPGAAILSAFAAYSLACEAALEWGEVVKAAYDVFLPKLLQTARFSPPANRAAEQSLWRGFSQAVLYRRPDLLPERANSSGSDAAPDAEKAEGERSADGEEAGDEEEDSPDEE